MFNNQTHYGSMAQGFMSKVYGWMCAGLAVTAAVSYYLSPEMNPLFLKAVMSNMWAILGLALAQFGILMYMSSQFLRLSYGAMGALFVLFCALQGIMLALILYV